MSKIKLLRTSLVALICMCAISLGATGFGSPMKNALAETKKETKSIYTLTQTDGAGISVSEVDEKGENGKYLKGFELKSDETYNSHILNTPSGGGEWNVNGKDAIQTGTQMSREDRYTFTVGGIDLSDGNEVSFLMNPTVHAEKGWLNNHRFVMALSDSDGEIKTAVDGGQNGFKADNDGHWMSIEANKYCGDNGNASAYADNDERRTKNPVQFRVGVNSSTDALTYDSASTSGIKRLACAMQGMFYTYNWGDGADDCITKFKFQDLLVKVTISIDEEKLTFAFDTVYKYQNGADDEKGSLYLENYVTANYNKYPDYYGNLNYTITEKLDNIGFTSTDNLRLSFGYYDADLSNSYSDVRATMPCDFGLYNLRYTNGTDSGEEFYVVEDQEVDSATQKEVKADSLKVSYPFANIEEETNKNLTFESSSNDNVATVDNENKTLTVKQYAEGDSVITVKDEKNNKATFTLTADCNTVKFDGNVVGGGASYEIPESGLYEGDGILLGYKAEETFYQVGEAITLEKDITLEAVTVNLAVTYTSVRVDGENAGIRFTAQISKSDLDVLKGLDENFTYGLKLEVNSKTYTVSSGDNNFQKVEGTDNTVFSAVLKNIPDTDYATKITATPFVKFTVKATETEDQNSEVAAVAETQGTEKVSEGKAVTKSLAEVAKTELADTKAEAEGDYKFKVEDGKYSRYTAAQRQVLTKLAEKADEEEETEGETSGTESTENSDSDAE